MAQLEALDFSSLLLYQPARKDARKDAQKSKGLSIRINAVDNINQHLSFSASSAGLGFLYFF